MCVARGVLCIQLCVCLFVFSTVSLISVTCRFFNAHNISITSRNGKLLLAANSLWYFIISFRRNCNIFLCIRLQRILVVLHATAIWLCCAMGLVAQCENMMSFITWSKAGNGMYGCEYVKVKYLFFCDQRQSFEPTGFPRIHIPCLFLFAVAVFCCDSWCKTQCLRETYLG